MRCAVPAEHFAAVPTRPYALYPAGWGGRKTRAEPAKFQAAAGGGVRDAIIQAHEVHRPAADVHQQHGRLVADKLRAVHDGRLSLREQNCVPNRDAVSGALEAKIYRLGKKNAES